MIRYENIHKVFGDLEVLKGVNFEIGTGEVVCILGPSGSGKTTLLRCTNFLEPPTRGIVTIADVTVEAGRHTKQQVHQLRQLSTMLGLPTRAIFRSTITLFAWTKPGAYL